MLIFQRRAGAWTRRESRVESAVGLTVGSGKVIAVSNRADKTTATVLSVADGAVYTFELEESDNVGVSDAGVVVLRCMQESPLTRTCEARLRGSTSSRLVATRTNVGSTVSIVSAGVAFGTIGSVELVRNDPPSTTVTIPGMDPIVLAATQHGLVVQSLVADGLALSECRAGAAPRILAKAPLAALIDASGTIGAIVPEGRGGKELRIVDVAGAVVSRTAVMREPIDAVAVAGNDVALLSRETLYVAPSESVREIDGD